MLFLEQTQGFGGAGSAIGNVQSPSLFELMMQERMGSGFKPAAEYLVHTLCESYPQLSLMLPVRRFEETFALVKYFVERYFLTRYDSLSTEKFYGMKRVMFHLPDGSSESAGGPAAEATIAPLTARAKKMSLIFAILLPYLKAKLDNYHKKLSEELPRTVHSSQQHDNNDQVTSSSFASVKFKAFLSRLRQLNYLYTLKKGFLKTYPFLHFAYEGTFFLYQWLYLLGDTPYFSPLLRRMKVILVRVTADDESAFRQNQDDYRAKLLEKLGGSSFFNRVRRFLLRASWMTLDHSYVLLILGIACYKFLEWMYSDEGVAAKMRMTGTDAPIPPPPLPPQFSGNALVISTMDPSQCPICKQQRTNPAMSVSGYVFCYTCIYRYVEDHGECPVTQMKCNTANIVKIYDDARES